MSNTILKYVDDAFLVYIFVELILMRQTYRSQNELSTARTAQIALWDETLEVKRSRLKPEEYEKLQSVADFATFRSTLQGLVDTHTQKRSSKIIQSLTPFLEHLRSLTAAIASLLKNTAIPAADLMWGVFQAVIQVRVQPLCSF